MHELTARGKAFRAAIAGFIDDRREAKLKGKEDDAGSASKYDYATWLADAASRAHNLKVVTHPIKFTHSGIKGASSVHLGAGWRNAPFSEIGTHSVGTLVEDFAISDAKHLDVYSLLKEVVDGRRLLDWLRDDDTDLAAALSGDAAMATALMDAFKQVFEPDERVTSHPLAKQVYWLAAGEAPSDDGQYHLLQPMFSSSLEHAVHEDIRAVREAGFSARGTRKQQATFADHATYPGLATRAFGGSNAQNVSPQNKARGGVNYLLASLPPPAWKPPDGVRLLGTETIFGDHGSPFLYFGDVRALIRELADFLQTDPEPNKETRERVATLGNGLAEALATFGTELRGHHDAGWTRAADCRLPLCEQLWLDPDRVELPLRDAAENPNGYADDLVFNTAYAQGDWADEVATRFGRWLNGQLRGRSDKLVALGAAEMRHFASLAILDVAWPIPQQRRAKAGAT